eukprot:Sspe_Gene.17354::Locus_6151_Transcript_1_1_Confidence_1.000_Length_813::g.17354::m.17354
MGHSPQHSRGGGRADRASQAPTEVRNLVRKLEGAKESLSSKKLPGYLKALDEALNEQGYAPFKEGEDTAIQVERRRGLLQQYRVAMKGILSALDKDRKVSQQVAAKRARQSERNGADDAKRVRCDSGKEATSEKKSNIPEEEALVSQIRLPEDLDALGPPDATLEYPDAFRDDVNHLSIIFRSRFSKETEQPSSDTEWKSFLPPTGTSRPQLTIRTREWGLVRAAWMSLTVVGRP